jgi:hypothetical protein
MSEKKKILTIAQCDGGWALTDKATGKQIAFVGENLPLDSYIPSDYEVEK